MEIISYKYSIPYLIFLFFLFLLLFVEFYQLNKKQSSKITRELVVVCFILFFGLKGLVGRDVFNYYNYFESLPTLWNWNINNFKFLEFDLGFSIFMSIVKSIIPNYFFFNFVNIVVDVIILNILMKRYSKYYVLGFIVYIVFYGYYFEIEQIRNLKAVLLFFLSLKCVEDKKLIPFLLINLLGVSFHFSALVYLPLYFILNKKFSPIVYLLIFIIGNIIFLFNLKYIIPVLVFVGDLLGGTLQTKIELYISNKLYSTAYGLSLGYIERIVTYLLVCFVFYKKLLQANKFNLIFINIYVLYFISFFYFTEINVAVVRLSALFVISYAILLPNIYAELSNKQNKLVVLSVLFLYMIVRLATYTKYIEYKYDNILWKVMSKEERQKNLKRSQDYQIKKELQNQ